MRLIYIVYREEDVMVYTSQVLEYLRELKLKDVFDEIELILFRHEKNIFRKEFVENRIREYIGSCYSFATFPIVTFIQLDYSVRQLKKYINKRYKKDEKIAVICRGDLAAYVGTKCFSDWPNSRVLYDNRGLAYEESVLSYGDKFIYKVNREIKRKAMIYAKSNCDMYNFVTTAMRDYLIDKYHYDKEILYTIIPTLYNKESIDEDEMNRIKILENYKESDYIVSYVGAIQAWQSFDKFLDIIKLISIKIPSARFIFLMKGDLKGKESLPSELQKRIIIKSVPHNLIKYYLQITDLGIVMRVNDIVSKVAAPTKIAEYLVNGVSVLYSGDIGIVNDLIANRYDARFINIDNDDKWIDEIVKLNNNSTKEYNTEIANYFDMNIRQWDTLKMIQKSFEQKKRGVDDL